MLRDLATRERMIVRLDLERYTAPEIADLLSRTGGKPVTAAAVRKCLERARKALRSTLEPLKQEFATENTGEDVTFLRPGRTNSVDATMWAGLWARRKGLVLRR